MRLHSFKVMCGLAICALVIGCSGGGGGNPTTPIAITTKTLNEGTVKTAYSGMLSATGGSGTYTWSVSSGTLPAGITLSSAGVFSGTPTAAGVSNFTVQAQDSESTPQTATQPLNLAISGGTLIIAAPLPHAGQVNVTYSFQMTASGGVPPYTWATNSDGPLPAGLTLSSSGVITGTPTTAGSYSVDFAVTDSSNKTFSQNVPMSINPSGSTLPDGGYALLFSGTGPKGPIAINAAFLIANQMLVAGGYDENIGSSGAQVSQSIAGITLTPGANGLNEMELKLAGNSTVTFALAMPASIITANNDTSVRIIEFDDATGSGTRGSGVLKIATSPANTAAIANNYAFLLSGTDSSHNPVAMAGSFSADGKGNITGYGADMNDNGVLTSVNPGFTGSYALNGLRGSLQLAWNSKTYNFSFYPVNATELYVISVDTLANGVPLLSGFIDQQTGTFSNASLKGAGVLELNGLASISGALNADVTLGIENASGAGNLSVSYDEYKGQLLSPQSFTGTYTVAATSGRVALSSSGTPAILYLLDTNVAFVLGGDSSASSGILEPQSGTSFSNSSFKGNYLGGSIALDSPSVINEVALAVPDGNGNVAITYNNSGSSGLKTNQSTTGTYAVDGKGRTVITAADGATRVFYVVSPTKAVLLSGEEGGYLGSFEQ